MATVSIVIPAYNAAKYLRETLDSALNQTYRDAEVIVVDDGSTDETPRILEQYGDRIQVLRQENHGRAAACNTGARAARGEWIAFLDADDIWLPDKLQRQVSECSQYAISHTNSFFFGEYFKDDVLKTSVTPQYGGWVLDRLLVGNFVTCSSVMMRREVYHYYGGFDTTFRYAEDWPLWLKVCAEHELGYVERPLVRYRVHEASKSRTVRHTIFAHLRIMEEAFAPGGVAHDRVALRRSALSSCYRVNAHYAAEVGDWTFSMLCAVRSLRYEPFVSRTWKTLIKAGLIPLGVKY
jgi:glycosyltransferase involved in cell wall biosynthesis